MQHEGGENRGVETRGSDLSDKLGQHMHRRSTDPVNSMWRLHRRMDDCEKNVSEIKKDISDLKNQQGALTNEFTQMNQHVGRMAEIMEAWNNAKGFWAVMRFMSAFAKVSVIVGGLAAAIWIFLKTGYWIKWDE